MNQAIAEKVSKNEHIVTNDLKKGDRVLLSYGDSSGPWQAEVADNKKGNIRLLKVFGAYTEYGSVYAHDIVAVQVEIDGQKAWHRLDKTPQQSKLRKSVKDLGF